MIVCGIDIGSTNVKVVLADTQGRSLWVKSVATPRRNDGVGIATDAGQMVALLEDLITLGWREVGAVKPLDAIAAAGIGEDGVCADDALSSLGLVIPWFDKRALPEVAEFSRRFALTRNDFHTTAGKWMWMRRHRPDEIGRASQWITLTDYASSLWCGEPFICETLAARTGCYDVFARMWNEGALAFSGAPPLPRILKAGEIAGTVRHGRLRAAGVANASTLIVAGGHDHPIASSAIARLDPAARVDSIGTANAIYGETQEPEPELAGSNLEASVPALGGPGIALIGVTEFSATLLASFGGEAAVRQLLDVAHAWQIGQGDRGPELRKALEAMAMRGRTYLDALAKAGVPQGPLFATGGWSRSTALMELRAGIFGEPVTVVDEPELTAMAACLLACEAASGGRVPFHPRHGLRLIEPPARLNTPRSIA